ncbi:hypothetical protein IVA98_08725 [Bradyrhizobium sp. 160]|uniref:hypothetical protein n=1 Tax=Bradyrhizobium sp. 160 TaxID=2782634 RepID=UPI001FF886E2|nr:hypothetical protein [Bradyrhizobium sp. 160]MCK1623310.1 hypothetical protein [Bradyrhizobium sp. 160]
MVSVAKCDEHYRVAESKNGMVPRAAIEQPQKPGITTMKSSRLALALAAALSLGAFVGSAQISPASAGQWDWLGNKPYVDCVKRADMARVEAQRVSSTPGIAEAIQKKGVNDCNRLYYPSNANSSHALGKRKG